MTQTRVEAAIVVLGMRRSGASALTRALGSLGSQNFASPSCLLDASAAHQTGFSETSKIKPFNGDILEWLNRSWLSYEPIDPNWDKAVSAFRWHERAQKLRAGEFVGSANPLVNLPRIGQLVGCWFEALSDFASRVVVPNIIRHPIEVTQSLSLRNGFDRDVSQLVGLRYNLDAEFASRSRARSFVNFRGLLHNWHRVIARVARHHGADDDAEMLKIGDFPWIGAPYNILYRWGEGETPKPNDLATLDENRAAIDTAAPVLAAMIDKGRLAEADATIADLPQHEGDRSVALHSGNTRAEIVQHIAHNQALAEGYAQLRTGLDAPQGKYKRMATKFSSAQTSNVARTEGVAHARAIAAANAVGLS